jgi:hypothetical protein
MHYGQATIWGVILSYMKRIFNILSPCKNCDGKGWFYCSGNRELDPTLPPLMAVEEDNLCLDYTEVEHMHECYSCKTY